MRNLSLAASTSLALPDVEIACSTTDLDQNVEYITSTTGEIYKDGVLFSKAAGQVVSMHILLDAQQLVLITRSGDITVIPLDAGVADVLGTVDGGIVAASWSPDDANLVLVTGDEKLILMTPTFDVLCEAPLYLTEFGQDAPINVGWGSKQTQFHGSAGKAAAVAPTKVAHTLSPDDDRLPRISWRGDGAFFAVSSISPSTFRVIRVYDRLGVLQTTSEDVPGLEHTLAWRPSGNLIAATQRFGYEGGGSGREGRHDVVFFERNGLRHGEFSIRVGELGVSPDAAGRFRWGYRIVDLLWSSDSSVLAVWIRTRDRDLVQLWTMGNYHWYLKQEIFVSAFTSVKWHPEKALAIILTAPTQIIHRTYAWETCCSLFDSGSVCVVDGASLLLTPFSTQNVPPPMSSYRLAVSRVPVHVCLSDSADFLAILWENGRAEVWALNTRLSPGRGKVMQPSLTRSLGLAEDVNWRQISFVNNRVIVLGSRSDGPDVLAITADKDEELTTIDLPSPNGHLIPGEVTVWQAMGGDIFEIGTSLSLILVAKFSTPCWNARRVSTTEPPLFIGHSESGKLFVTAMPDSEATALISSNTTSFTIASGFLVFTTGGHEAVFAPMHTLLDAKDKDNEMAWEKRRIERGARIVVPVPSAMSLVLQMPRGNLETINPRPLVMEVVKQDLDKLQYRKAFLACRKHRIDLNVLVDHDREALLRHIGTFVDQVEEADYVNLFLTNVGRSEHSAGDIAVVCDVLRVELEKRDLTNYVNSILTAHVVKTPPDHEAGLALLLKLRDGNPHLVEDAVKYIIFLVDAEKLYNTALGMYDFSLVLMIAQHAQKDPREYLPFLRELRAMEQYIQRHKIDDHLKRYESALRNLSLAGDEHFEEAIDYIESHQLYESALLIWKDTPRYSAVLTVYGDWLFERREFRQAASVFVEASALEKAMVAYEKALEWQPYFDLAIRTEVSEEDVVAAAYRLAEDLSAKKRHLEAARVLLDYTGDVRATVITMTLGNAFSEARRVATLKRKPELVEDVIQPAALETRAQIAEDLKEMGEQLEKQFARLLELRIKRVEEPDAFFGVEDSALQNVDVMTDVSMPYTAFTRYTVAPTTTSRASSKRTSRSKRKQERKVGSGRKGTVDEEEYLVKSLVKLATRFATCREETKNLIPHLFEFTAEHRAKGLTLQKEVDAFERKLQDAVDEIWKKNSDESGEPKDSWAARMEQAEKARLLNPVDAVPKPEWGGKADWRLRLFDLES